MIFILGDIYRPIVLGLSADDVSNVINKGWTTFYIEPSLDAKYYENQMKRDSSFTVQFSPDRNKSKTTLNIFHSSLEQEIKLSYSNFYWNIDSEITLR